MQKKQNNKNLIWFRNNLRTQDNTSLFNAINNNNNNNIIAVYFFDTKYFKTDDFGFKKTAKYRAKFLIETVTELKKNLAELNITLLTYFDAPENKIHKICTEFSVNAIYTQKEWTNEEVEINNLVKKTIAENIRFIEDYGQFLYHPNTVSKDFSKIPNVFTQFRKQLEKTVKIKELYKVSKLSEDNLIKNNTEIPTLKNLDFNNFDENKKTAFPFSGGENAALKRLNYYFFETKKVAFYKKNQKRFNW